MRPTIETAVTASVPLTISYRDSVLSGRWNALIYSAHRRLAGTRAARAAGDPPAWHGSRPGVSR
jgi:hypothetical protein